MNIVGIRTDNHKIFTSQSFTSDKQKNNVIDSINKEATEAGLVISIQEMTDNELEDYIR